MEKEINEFLQYLSACGKSKCTISAYKGDLAAFAEIMSVKSITDIKYNNLRAWADSLVSDGLSASSCSRKISSVKSFFRYCWKMDIVKDNPAKWLECPKIEKKQPTTISMIDASNLLHNASICNNGSSGVTWFRNYAILCMFLYTGVRREELTNIKISDVDLQKQSILIHGKGAKQRYVYINDTLLAVLSEYMEGHRKLFKTSYNSEYLFPSTMSAKISLKMVNNVVNKSFEQSGIKVYGLSAHILRKRFATSIFESTSDIATTSKLLGHSSPAVTMRYVVIGENIMRAATNSVNF